MIEEFQKLQISELLLRAESAQVKNELQEARQKQNVEFQQLSMKTQELK
jgi:hypothetical protein